jgi:PAS domain S-box-containing protein
LEELVRLAPDATVVVDALGHIRLVNHHAEELFGYSAEELLGQPVELLVPERLRAAHQQHRAGYAAAPHARPFGANLPLSGQRHDGSEFPIEASLGPLDEYGESYVIVSIHDISALQWVHDTQVAAQVANQDLQALQAVTDTALSHLALDDLLPVLLERITDVLGVDNSAVLLLDEAGQTLTIQAVYGHEQPRSTKVRVPMGQGFAGRIAATREPLVVDDIATFPVANPLFCGQLHSVVGVPLVLGEQLLGVVHVGTVRSRHFSARDVQLLQQVADRIALAIDRARLYESEQQARWDAEAALARAQLSETRFQRLMEAGIVGIVVGDSTKVIEANDAYLRMVGYTREDLEAGNLTGAVLSPPPEQELTKQMVQHALQTGESVLQEKEYIRKDGSRVPVLVGIVLVQRDPVRLVSIVLDLSDRKRLEWEREAARAEAEQQTTQLAAIFEAIADGVVVFDAGGHLVRENSAHQRLMGIDTAPPQFTELPLLERVALFSARDEQGRPLKPDEGPLPRALRGEVFSGAETLNIRSRTLDGREVELSVSAAPLRDREGHLTGAVGIFRDQTERKQLERERADQAEQLDRIFEGITDGLVVYNVKGQLMRLNAAARRILGLDAAPAEYSQLGVRDRLRLYGARDEQDRPLAHEEWPVVRVLRGQVTGADSREIRLRALDGREVELNLSATPLHDREGRLTGAVVVLHDQTEYKRLAREREEAHASELAAEEIAEQLNAFLAVAAHDIRTPVTVISSQVQLALRRSQRLAAGHTADERSAQAADDVAESLGIAWAGVKRLRRLVEHLFDVAQAQTGTLTVKLSACDLSALVRGHVAAQQETVPGRHIGVKVPAEAVPVQADADRLDQVLGNYLSNALKYSPSDQPVTVRLEVVENQAILSVTDHGPGLPQEEQSRIWELFHRVPGIEVQSWSGESSGSLGLGLHICKQLMELHPGGRVGVESVPGEGSTFWFRLPLAS